MPIIVSCPTCNGQLRVADDLIGRRVRCPTCQGIFEAAEPSAPPPEPAPAPGPPAWPNVSPPAPTDDIPVETVPLKPMLNLSLDSDAPPAPPHPVQSVPRLGPLGPIRFGDASDDAPAPPREERRDDGDDRRRLRRDDDRDDDTSPCPRCGRRLPRDARRCHNCGTARDYDDEPRSRSGRREIGPRRDCEPHRSGLVLTLGIVGLVLSLMCFLAPIGMILGLVGWVMGQRDLRKIKAGNMDPEGEGSTQAGWICGIIATVIGALTTFGCGGFYGLIYYSSLQASKQRNNPTWNAPPSKGPPKGN